MKETEQRHHAEANSRIAFVGDSITAAGDWGTWFPNDSVANLGISGDTSDDVLARLAEIVEYDPHEICLLVGTNDLGAGHSVEHLVRNLELLLVELRRELPEVRLLVQSIMPRGKEFADRLHESNIHLRQFAPTVHALYLDLWPALAGDDGALRSEYSDDELHLTRKGYEAWLAVVRPALAELRTMPPTGSADFTVS